VFFFFFFFFFFLYCKNLLPAASQTICQPPTLLLTTNWCNQTAINQSTTQFFFPFPNALLLPPPSVSARAHWLHEFIHFYFSVSSIAWIHSFPNAFSVCLLVALIHSFHLLHQIPQNHLRPNFQTCFLHS